MLRLDFTSFYVGTGTKNLRPPLLARPRTGPNLFVCSRAYIRTYNVTGSDFSGSTWGGVFQVREDRGTGGGKIRTTKHVRTHVRTIQWVGIILI